MRRTTLGLRSLQMVESCPQLRYVTIIKRSGSDHLRLLVIRSVFLSGRGIWSPQFSSDMTAASFVPTRVVTIYKNVSDTTPTRQS